MEYKHSCIIDAEGCYKTVVQQRLENQDGTEQWRLAYYRLSEGERLVEAAPPAYKPCAGAPGFINPRWNGEGWEEGASREECSAWEAAHPAASPASDPRDEVIAQLMREVSALKAAQSSASATMSFMA